MIIMSEIMIMRTNENEENNVENNENNENNNKIMK